MNRRLMSFVVALAACLSCASIAHAEAEPGQGSINIMGSYIDDDPERALDDEIAGGHLGFGYAINERWDVELFVQGASISGPFADQDQLGVGVDLRRVFNRDGWLSPYLFAGLGLLQVNPEFASSQRGGMYAGGVGFFIDMFGASNVALRAEYRLRGDDALGPTLNDDIISLGLQIPFGRADRPVTDADADGVPDGMDRCPGTPRGTAVDEFGCAVDTDGDGDGVADDVDQCPSTPAGADVDARGCELDDDGDGVANSLDQCANTPRGASVDAEGCELDGDGDGVSDSRDECPNTADGARVDTRGCEITDAIRLPSVQFETNSDRLRSGAESSLNDAVVTLRRYPELRVEVEGHTDSDGAADYNEGLSYRRAETVRDYLVAAGIDADRLTVGGYGETRPIADNATADGKRQNRRVVLRLLNQ